jgi:hypothetical protein
MTTPAKPQGASGPSGALLSQNIAQDPSLLKELGWLPPRIILPEQGLSHSGLHGIFKTSEAMLWGGKGGPLVGSRSWSLNMHSVCLIQSAPMCLDGDFSHCLGNSQGLGDSSEHQDSRWVKICTFLLLEELLNYNKNF